MEVARDVLEAALECLPEGVGLISEERKVLYWNRAAEIITGFPGMELIGRALPEALESMLNGDVPQDPFSSDGLTCARSATISIQNKQGRSEQLMARSFVLRDAMGARMGLACLFHEEEQSAALPHGEYEDDLDAEMQRAEFEDKLGAIYEEFVGGGRCFGLLWILIDQSANLRRTHGSSACRNMIEKIERALALGVRPGELMARWGDDEFLVLLYERSAELLETHAQTLAGLARTVDFRWWGDRVQISVSIGAAMASAQRTLAELLNQARSGMKESAYAGGNQITFAAGGSECSPS